jgi:hypothetical protein
MERTNGTARYRLLQKYLDERHADTVVLMFSEIEDILGFPLPDPARRQPDWWANPTPDGTASEQSRSWTSGTRTAGVNLTAQKVTFTRLIAPGPSCSN